MAITDGPRDTPRLGASDLLRSLGLLVDGPAVWGRPVSAPGAGVFVVELPGGAPGAALDGNAIKRWLERVPDLRLDGARPTPPELERRLAEFWLPHEPIVFVGRSARSIGQRLAAIYATELGDARPTGSAHWLKALSNQATLRVWWAQTDAHEEYEDAILTAVATRNAVGHLPPVLPFANLLAADGTARAHGLTDSLRREPESSEKPAASASAKGTRRAASPAAKARAPRVREPAPKRPQAATHISREGLDRLTAELEELKNVVRPQVIARVAAARELGDLRENADYEYARKEQSFTEGRIQALEQAVRTSVVIEQPVGADVVHLGSTVVVESEGEQDTYVIVGSTEADPAGGKLSNASPVGRALLGARAGDLVTVELPSRAVTYKVVEIR